MAQHPDVEVYHGKKRPAESDLDGEQPLAKKFNRLHIDPIAIDHAPETPKESLSAASQQSPSTSTDMMMLDDTKHRVYIHDLDREIAETEPPSDPITFLPGVEQSLGAIPKFLVADGKPVGNELVLYKEPTSLTVSKERDTVCKALIETRERARTRRCERCPCTHSVPCWGTIANADRPNNTHHSDDAMEIDAGV